MLGSLSTMPGFSGPDRMGGPLPQPARRIQRIQVETTVARFTAPKIAR
jgi:hypothetical protein